MLYNGGVGKEQLLWLEKELTEATAAGQRVIAFGHVPIHPIDAPSNCLVWNYKDVRMASNRPPTLMFGIFYYPV